MQYGVVYCITNLETGKSYIGRTKRPLRERWYDHCHRLSNCTYLKNAIAKYGKESFSIQAIASSWDAASLTQLEAIMIVQENTLAPNGYNLVNTGEGISEVSEVTRKKLSIAGKGRTHTEEARKKISKAKKGKPCSEEHRQSMSRTRTGRPSRMKGKTFSDEARKNMGGQNKGTTASAATKQKMSQVRKGQYWYTNGVQDCRIREGEPIPDGFSRGRTKGLDNLTMLAQSWENPEYRHHMSEIHKKQKTT